MKPEDEPMTVNSLIAAIDANFPVDDGSMSPTDRMQSRSDMERVIVAFKGNLTVPPELHDCMNVLYERMEAVDMSDVVIYSQFRKEWLALRKQMSSIISPL